MSEWLIEDNAGKTRAYPNLKTAKSVFGSCPEGYRLLPAPAVLVPAKDET